MKACPCGSNQNYDQCCGPFIGGRTRPATAVQLMRSRYTAFALADVNYLQATMVGPGANQFNAEQIRTWAKSVKWIRLKILSTTLGGPDDKEGHVHFVATYKDNSKAEKIEENSQFVRKDGHWVYWSP